MRIFAFLPHFNYLINLLRWPMQWLCHFRQRHCRNDIQRPSIWLPRAYVHTFCHIFLKVLLNLDHYSMSSGLDHKSRQTFQKRQVSRRRQNKKGHRYPQFELFEHHHKFLCLCICGCSWSIAMRPEHLASLQDEQHTEPCDFLYSCINLRTQAAASPPSPINQH